MHLSFSKADEVLLSALACDVRFLSIDQASRLLRCDPNETQLIAERLASGGYLTQVTSIVSVDATPLAPIYSWGLGKEVPNYRAAAYQFRKRWKSPGEQQLLFPTNKACKIFGGTRMTPRSQGETDHDLWVSEVYLRYCRKRLGGAGLSWRSGDTLRMEGKASQFSGLVPDACLVRRDGSIERIVESGGKGYASAKLSKLHHCYSQHNTYEVW